MGAGPPAALAQWRLKQTPSKQSVEIEEGPGSLQSVPLNSGVGAGVRLKLLSPQLGKGWATVDNSLQAT